MHDLTIAFAMQADMASLTYEQGVRLAESIGDEMMQAAKDRADIPGIQFEKPREDD